MERTLGDRQRGVGEPAGGGGALRREQLVHGLLPLLARLAITAEFVIAGLGKALGWSGQAAYMASQGMTMIVPLLATALAIEAVGSLCLIPGSRPGPPRRSCVSTSGS